MCLEPLYEHSCVTLRNPTVARGERGEGAAARTYIFQWKPSHEVHAVILEDKSQVLRVTLCRLEDTCFGKGSLLTRSFVSSGGLQFWNGSHLTRSAARRRVGRKQCEGGAAGRSGSAKGGRGWGREGLVDADQRRRAVLRRCASMWGYLKAMANCEVRINVGGVRRGRGAVAEQLPALGCTTRVK